MKIVIILILADVILSVAFSLLINFLPNEASSQAFPTNDLSNTTTLSNYSFRNANIINKTTCIGCLSKTNNGQPPTFRNENLARKIVHIRDHYQNVTKR